MSALGRGCVKATVRNRHVLRPEHECGCDDDQARRLVENDALERRESKKTQEQRQSELSPTETDQRAYDGAPSERCKWPASLYCAHRPTNELQRQ